MTMLVIGMALLIYACRIAGFLVTKISLTGYWERFFRLLPIAVFATLATAGLTRAPDLHSGHMLALLIAGLTAWRTRQIGLSVLVGLGMLWALSIMGAA